MSNRHDTGFAHREVMAPVGLWERGAEASGCIPPSARLFQIFLKCSGACREEKKRLVRAPKANAISPAGEILTLHSLAVCGGAQW